MKSKTTAPKKSDQLKLTFNEMSKSISTKISTSPEPKIIQLNPRKDLYSKILERR